MVKGKEFHVARSVPLTILLGCGVEVWTLLIDLSEAEFAFVQTEPSIDARTGLGKRNEFKS